LQEVVVMLAHARQPSGISVAAHWWQQQGSCNNREIKITQKQKIPINRPHDAVQKRNREEAMTAKAIFNRVVAAAQGWQHWQQLLSCSKTATSRKT